MKKTAYKRRKRKYEKFLICGLFLLMIILTGCFKNTTTIQEQPETYQPKNIPTGKVLIAYFSRVGNTDFSNDVDTTSSASILKRGNEIVGNTQYLAELIQQSTQSDLFLIKTEERYPADYHETDLQGKEENVNQRKVKLADHIQNMDEYDTIFLGYPTWYYDMPMAIYAFLEEYDLAGKTIIPFNTNGGSGFSNSITDIQKQEPEAIVVTDGLAISHHRIAELTMESVQEWLENLQITN